MRALQLKACFHAQLSVAPLKRTVEREMIAECGGFHAQLSVAPLKQRRCRHRRRASADGFPRSAERGSIEADRTTASLCRSESFHAQLSVAPLKRRLRYRR